MSERPSGTVTFLFTDIEGSTQLWEQQSEAMRVALARHDAVVRQAIEAHGGYVFKTVGDAFCAAFPTAPDALNAAIDAQRALLSAAWGETGPLRVRMALHTGMAQERDGDYFGQPLNRVARLMSTGYGGQVLLSQPTCELVRDHLPAGVSLRDLHEHQLKDLIRPEHVYQLLAPDLPSDFPPLRSLSTRPNNLPVQPTALIGREREVEELTQLLSRPHVRLVTLIGPGGTGKTSLSLQVVADLLDAFPHGVFFVDLSPITDPVLVVSTIATTLGAREQPGRLLLDSLKDYLRDKAILVLLDNYEQVMPAASVVADLLAAAPGLKVVVTSREVLRLRGEYEYPVVPLAVPPRSDAGQGTGGPKSPGLSFVPTPAAISQYSAVALFIERAVAVKPDFQVTNANAPAVAEICARLDGLPLAIELAAARIRLFSPQAMLTRLSNRLKLLTGGARDLPARQQTLRGAIDWSYDLLDEGEKTLFRRLGAFVGGFTLEAVQAICLARGDLGVDVLDGIESLVSKSLVRQREEPDGTLRFVMLETIREYALERLRETAEAETVRKHHAAYFLAFSEAAARHLEGPEDALWLDRLEIEHDNLRATLGWTLATDEVELACRLGAALRLFWFMRGHMTEGRERLGQMLKRSAGTLAPAQRARVLDSLGFLARYQGDYAAAYAFSHESLAIQQALGNRQAVADALANLGYVAFYQGDYPLARSLYDESLTIQQELDNRQGIADALVHLGAMAFYEDNHHMAQALYEQSLAIWEALGDKLGIAYALNHLGTVAVCNGNVGVARSHYMTSLNLNRELGTTWGLAVSIEGFARLAVAQVQPERAVRLAGAAVALRDAVNTPLSQREAADFQRALAPTRQALGEEVQALAWTEGRAMTPERAIEYALASV